ncbi:hypothetical protein COO60DRAFT_1127701 [Scenedesmus sp. NREL 46B-D3]|nr:hypothetical protein COO60DRAFT_1127701 [Scenedesmus sp. NREL 46B-D3]
MLLAHSTGQSLANVPRQQCRNQTLATANQAPLTVTYSRSNTADAAVTRAPAQTATTQLEDIRQAIERDFSDGQYYVTGNLTSSLYDPNCTFKDPTTNVKGVQKYTAAVAALFDPAVSRADLVSSSVAGPNSISLRWRLEGRLKIGNLPIKPYTGSTVYTVDEGSGLITRHDEAWDISAVDAFVSTLFPGLKYGAPPAPPVK